MTRPSRPELLAALVNGENLETVVPQALDIVTHDPLIAVHSFPGDLLRGLMEVSAEFWSRRSSLYEQYRAAVRAGAEARLHLPIATRLAFWSPLELHEPSADAVGGKSTHAGSFDSD